MTEDNNDVINDNGLINPHDGLFKILLQDKEIAKEFLEVNLPERYQKICDLDTISIEPSSFIETDFTPYYNDILYSLNTKNGKKGYVYVLVEHQSSPDTMIAWRLINYAMLAIAHHIKQHTHQKSTRKKSPVVIPLLFYTGSKPHPKSISLDWFDIFDDPELAREVYNQPFEIRDVNQLDDTEIMQHKRAGLLEYLYKNIRKRDLMLIKDEIDYLLTVNLFTREQRKSILIYIVTQGKIEQPQQLLEALTTKSVEQEGKKAMTTLADYLREEGIKQGMIAGMQKGQVETTQAIARNMLQKGSDLEFIRSVTGLTEEEIKKLQL